MTTERTTAAPITPPEIPATVTSVRAPAITATPAPLPAAVPYGPVNAPPAVAPATLAQAAYSDALGQNDPDYHIAADERGGWQANTPAPNINNAFIGKQSSTNKRYPRTWSDKISVREPGMVLHSIDLHENTLVVGGNYYFCVRIYVFTAGNTYYEKSWDLQAELGDYTVDYNGYFDGACAGGAQPQ